MQEIIASSSLQQLDSYYVNVILFSVSVSKPTRKLYGCSVEWYTVEAYVTYIKNIFKNSRLYHRLEKNFEN